MNGAAILVASLLAFQPQPTQPAATPRPVAPAHEAFQPSRHGLKFRNHFEGSPLPPALRDPANVPAPLREALGGVQVPSTFGLCGGMSATAADYFLAGVPIPAATSPPTQGTPLYDYLYQRQVDSLGPSAILALKFWTWMHLSDAPPPAAGETSDSDTPPKSIGQMTAGELSGIVTRVRAQGLCAVGLVYVRGEKNHNAPTSPVGSLWQNHQVLCFKVEEPAPGVTDLRVYDPNYPGRDDVVIRVTPKREAAPADGAPDSAGVEQRVGDKVARRVRGCFAMPYVPKQPPAGEPAGAGGK